MAGNVVFNKPFWNLLQESQNFVVELQDRFGRPPYLEDLDKEREWNEFFLLLEEGVRSIERRLDLLQIHSDYDFVNQPVREQRFLYTILLTFRCHLKKLLLNIEVAEKTQDANNFFRYRM